MIDRDPFIQSDVDNRSASVIQIESLGKGAWAILTAAIVLSAVALALAVSASQTSRLAEREARVAQDRVVYLQGELAKSGINVNANDH